MVDSRLASAYALHQAGSLAEAESLYQSVLANHENCEEALYHVAIIAAERGDYASAASYLQKLHVLNQKDPRILLALANVYSSMRMLPSALTTLLALIREFPDYAPAYHNLGVYHYRSKEWLQAITAFKTAIEKQPHYVDAYYHLGLVYFAAGQLAESKECFDAVLHLDAVHVGARFHIACVQLKMGHLDAAFSLFSALYNEHPNHFPTQVNLSHCYLAKQDMKNAKKLLEAAHQIAPGDTQVLFNLGVLSYHMGQLDHAAFYYKAVLKCSYNDVAARYNLALLYLAQKEKLHARAELQLLAEIAPQFEPALYLLQALSGNTAIKAAPSEFVSMLFDQYAVYYDAHMKQLNYSVPDKLYQLVEGYLVKDEPLDCVLDLGVGTGQMGVLLKPYAKQLMGVDLSSAMLEVARAKAVYAELYQDDVIRFLQYEVDHASIDCIVAADCLVYIGDLQPLLVAAALVLKSGGYFLFNVEKTEDDQYQLQHTGRFAHSFQYVQSLLGDVFTCVSWQECMLRYQGDQPVVGYICLLQRVSE